MIWIYSRKHIEYTDVIIVASSCNFCLDFGPRMAAQHEWRGRDVNNTYGTYMIHIRFTYVSTLLHCRRAEGLHQSRTSTVEDKNEYCDSMN